MLPIALFDCYSAPSCVDQIKSPLDTSQPFVKPVHPLRHGSEQDENLPGYLFQCGYAALEIGNVEFGPLLRRADAPEHFQNQVVCLFRHRRYRFPTRAILTDVITIV
jgi:hypothetical protein